MVKAQANVKWLAVGLAVAFGAAGFALLPGPAGAVDNVCVARTSSSPGKLSWQLRQASGLTSLAASPNVLFTHNDRGIRDSPGHDEDTEYAAVWAIGQNGQALARFRLTSGGTPIPYFDTEAISRDPQGRLVLADTGTNVDGRVTVALYRFTPPPVTAGQALRGAGRPRRGDPAGLLRQRHHLDAHGAQRRGDGHRPGRQRVVRASQLEPPVLVHGHRVRR